MTTTLHSSVPGLAPVSLSEAQALGLAENLGAALSRQGLLVGTAESCTGGLLAGAITSVAGSSGWFERGFVTYTNTAKIENLSVSEDTLERFGAVSEAVALEMATGVLLATPHAHIAVSTTGIAGPGGATPGKPVGMVCFGFAMRSAQGITSRSQIEVFSGDRTQIRQAAVIYALLGLLELVGEPVNRSRA